MEHSSTPQAAKTIGIKPSALARAVWDGRVNPPQKSPAGNYLWTARDIEHASWVLCGRSAGLEDGPQHIKEILPKVVHNIEQGQSNE